MQTFIGIDPGLSGAIAVVQYGKLLHVRDMPTVEYKVAGKKTRREVDLFTLSHIIAATPKMSKTYMEALAGMPRMGGTQMFALGQTYGMLKATLFALQRPYDLVSPQRWKKYFDLSRDKDEARALAMQKFPDRAHLFERKKDDGRAEAALIALYGFEQSGSTANSNEKEPSNGN